MRLDATHAIKDEGSRHFLAELSACVRGSVAHRPVHLIAEDNRNLAAMLKPENRGGDGGWMRCGPTISIIRCSDI